MPLSLRCPVRRQYPGWKSRPARQLRPRLEALEVRLAPAMTVSVIANQVAFTGDDASDSLVVTELGGRLQHNLPLGGNLVSSLDMDSAAPGEQVVFLANLQGLELSGNGGDDVLNASAVNFPATFLGGPGDDQLFGGPADDQFFGGKGFDLFQDLVNGTATLTGTVVGKEQTGGDYTSNAVKSVNHGLEGGRLLGGPGSDVLDASGWVGPGLRLEGRDGNDTLRGGTGDDTLVGGPGDDRFFGGKGIDFFSDVVSGQAILTDTTYSSNGVVSADHGLDDGEIIGADGPDLIDASGWRLPVGLFLDGRGGNDTLRGGRGNDTITGGAGVDTLDQTGDVDMAVTGTSFNGGAVFGTDTLEAIEVAVLTGGAGPNRLDARDFPGPVRLFGAGRDDILVGGPGADRLVGGPGDDVLFGGDGDDVLTGDAGLNSLNGGAGVDHVEQAGSGAFSLSDALLLQPGLQCGLASIEGAVLLGSALADHFDVSGWTKSAGLYGRGGTDRVFLSRPASYTLTARELRVSPTNFFGLDAVEAATLVGGAGPDRFVVAGWAGTAELRGGPYGQDQLVSVGDFDMTLANGSLVRDRGRLGRLDLVGISRAILLGGEGANLLNATAFTLGGVVLVGNGGNDTLRGGAGRDVLIGGRGADALLGNAGDDVLVSGFTNYDGGVGRPNLIALEWARTAQAYPDRVGHLLGTLPGGINGTVVLNAATVRNDTERDVLVGGPDLDWFLGVATEVADLNNGGPETVTVLPEWRDS
ncbi:MAG: calcium-binding protein [Gemmataceae bacterium]